MRLFNAQAKAISISVAAVASASVALPGKGSCVRIVNEGPDTAFISIGSGTQTATTPNSTPAGTATPVLPSSDIILSIPSDQVYNISAICRSAGSATLDVQVGEGA